MRRLGVFLLLLLVATALAAERAGEQRRDRSRRSAERLRQKFDGLEHENLWSNDPVGDIVRAVAAGGKANLKRVTVVANNNALNSTLVVDDAQLLKQQAKAENQEIDQLEKMADWEDGHPDKFQLAEARADRMRMAVERAAGELPPVNNNSNKNRSRQRSRTGPSRRDSSAPAEIELDASALKKRQKLDLTGTCVFQASDECGMHWQESGFTLVPALKTVIDSGVFPFPTWVMRDGSSYMWTKAYLCCAMDADAEIDPSEQFVLGKKCPNPPHMLGGLLFKKSHLTSRLPFDRDIDVANREFRIIHTEFCNIRGSYLDGSVNYDQTFCVVGNNGCPRRLKDMGEAALVLADPTSSNLDKEALEISERYNVNPFAPLVSAQFKRGDAFFINGVDRGFYLGQTRLCCTKPEQ